MHRKFIVLTFIITAGLYLLYSYFVLNHKMLYMDREYPMWEYTKNVINTKSTQKYDLLAIGDSRVKAGFIPVNNNKTNSLNLSLGGGTPMEGYYTLKKYLKNNPAPNKLILSYVSGHLTSFSNYWKRTVPFEFVTLEEHKEIMVLAKEYNELAITSVSKEYIDYSFPNTYASNFKNGLLGARWITNKSVLELVEMSRGQHFFGTNNFSNGLSGDAYRKSFIASRFHTYYLTELIKLANDHNTAVYFYYMPHNESSFNKLDVKTMAAYTNFIFKLSKENSMKICNDLFYMTNDNFGDPSHLYLGAEKNTKMMYQCILN
jgi:hypothetical protein